MPTRHMRGGEKKEQLFAIWSNLARGPVGISVTDSSGVQEGRGRRKLFRDLLVK